jgi:hypothetical protein
MKRLEKTESPEGLVNRLLKEQFAPGRAPRSAEYKAGVRAKLVYYVYECDLLYPYPAGSVRADAFYAGVKDGAEIWDAHLRATALNAGGNNAAP